MQAQLIEQMKALRLRGMASALEESLTALSHKKLAPTAWLSQLLQAEAADRLARSYEYQLRLARFPMPRDLDSFDFRESSVNETQLRQLYAGEYLTGARNIVFVGGTEVDDAEEAGALALKDRLAGQSGRQVRLAGTAGQHWKPVDNRETNSARTPQGPGIWHWFGTGRGWDYRK